MSMPYYVSPEQVMKDRAEYAQKGISKGRALVACEYKGGIVFVSDNPSSTLFKISEIYDRIAFAGVGKYNEFQSLRNAGVRIADVKGYSYSRNDVTASEIANIYAQTLGEIFTNEMKPYEVQILVAELSENEKDPNKMYQVTYDGTISDKSGFTVLGGADDSITISMESNYKPGLQLSEAVKISIKALKSDAKTNPSLLEVAVLERGTKRRCFRRIEDNELSKLLK